MPTVEQIQQAIRNTIAPVINRSPEVLRALKNSELKTPCGKQGEIETQLILDKELTNNARE